MVAKCSVSQNKKFNLYVDKASHETDHQTLKPYLVLSVTILYKKKLIITKFNRFNKKIKLFKYVRKNKSTR